MIFFYFYDTQLHVLSVFCLNKALKALSWVVLLKYCRFFVPVPPTLLGSDDVRTLTVPINGHLTLECLADSDPAPEIEWFKDEAQVQVLDGGNFNRPPRQKACGNPHSVCVFSHHQLGGRIQRLAGGQYLEIQEVRPEDSGHYSCVVTNMAGSTSLFFTVEIIRKSTLSEILTVFLQDVLQFQTYWSISNIPQCRR